MTTTHTPQDYSAALLRVSLGTLILSHGYMKAFVWTVAGTVGYFTSLGLPEIAAHLVIFGELAGGLALILGILTRPAAVLLLPILLGAAVVHSGNGMIFSSQGGGWEFPVLLVALAVIVAIQGAGAFALGRKLPFLKA